MGPDAEEDIEREVSGELERAEFTIVDFNPRADAGEGGRRRWYAVFVSVEGDDLSAMRLPKRGLCVRFTKKRRRKTSDRREVFSPVTVDHTAPPTSA